MTSRLDTSGASSADAATMTLALIPLGLASRRFGVCPSRERRVEVVALPVSRRFPLAALSSFFSFRFTSLIIFALTSDLLVHAKCELKVGQFMDICSYTCLKSFLCYYAHRSLLMMLVDSFQLPLGRCSSSSIDLYTRPEPLGLDCVLLGSLSNTFLSYVPNGCPILDGAEWSRSVICH